MLTALILLIICSAIIVITLRWLDNTGEAPIDEIDPFQVIITSDELACEHSRRKREEVPWDEIHEIVLLTLSEGPPIPDRWLIFVGDDRGCSIPTEAHGAHHLWNEIKIRFPGFDFNLKIASVLWPDMQGTGHAAVVFYRNCLVTRQIRSKGVPEG